jgi:hypothetical protein
VEPSRHVLDRLLPSVSVVDVPFTCVSPQKGNVKMLRIASLLAPLLIMSAPALFLQRAASAEGARLEPGHYELTILTPEMADESNRKFTVPAELLIDRNAVEVRTQGKLGNKFVLRGITNAGILKAGTTITEDSSVLSFHYLGTVESDRHVKGTFVVFIDGKEGFSGTWELNRRNTDEAPNP